MLALGLGLRLQGLVAPALVLLGLEYAGLFLVREASVDLRAPLYGAGFLLVAELAYAALELRSGGADPDLARRRAALLVVLALGGVALGAAVLAVSDLSFRGGLALEAAGVAAAVALLLLLGSLSLRGR